MEEDEERSSQFCPLLKRKIRTLNENDDDGFRYSRHLCQF